ncbi:short chain dehydrogenase [Actinomadura macra]|uniref:short chain dehydrogenase n=1 Tax=Actinomadura macra TaxID=46164 RepID=UPI00082F15B0|nr:short chain dehydrogenase [Actinomadura macra]
MKIVVIGATGTIGTAVVGLLGKMHEVVQVSRKGPVRVDLADPASIDALFTTVRDINAVVCCAASVALAPLDSDTDVAAGLQGKLLGQVHLVRQALNHLRDGGSITLTSGVFDRPMRGASFGALTNAGLEAFVRAAAIEMPRGLRVNVVSPGWVAETLDILGRDAADGTPAADVALAYAEAVEGSAQGRTLSPKRT